MILDFIHSCLHNCRIFIDDATNGMVETWDVRANLYIDIFGSTEYRTFDWCWNLFGNRIFFGELQLNEKLLKKFT